MANPFISHPDLGAAIQPAEPTSEPQVVEPRQETPTAPASDPNDIAAQKYGDDIAKTRQGYNEMFNEVQGNLMPRLSAAEQRAKQLEQLVMQHMGQPQTAQPQGKSPEDELAELGIPAQAVIRLAERIADQRVANRLDPLDRTLRAQQELASEIPDFSAVAPEAYRWLANQPQLQNDVNELAAQFPKQAAKLVLREFQAWKSSQPRGSAAANGFERNGAVLPSTQVGTRAAPERNFEKELEQARSYATQTGDERPYWKIYWERQNGGQPMHPAFTPPSQ